MTRFRRHTFASTISAHGTVDPDTLPPHRLDPDLPYLLAVFNAGVRRAADGAAQRADRMPCGRCGWPETPTHTCKTPTDTQPDQ